MAACEVARLWSLAEGDSGSCRSMVSVLSPSLARQHLYIANGWHYRWCEARHPDETSRGRVAGGRGRTCTNYLRPRHDRQAQAWKRPSKFGAASAPMRNRTVSQAETVEGCDKDEDDGGGDEDGRR